MVRRRWRLQCPLSGQLLIKRRLLDLSTGADGQILDDADRDSVESLISWVPDGSFYYGKQDAIYGAQVGSAPSSDELVHRSDAEDGFVSALAVSSDGTRLAVEMDTSEVFISP